MYIYIYICMRMCVYMYKVQDRNLLSNMGRQRRMERKLCSGFALWDPETTKELGNL